MKVSVVAFDYDGTVASEGVLHADVRTALGELRARGILAVAVTGRTLGDLQRLAGDLGFADAVVAENGAVLHFPDRGLSRVLGRPAPGDFLAGLQSQGIEFEVGECVVEAAASVASSVMALIRELEAPLSITFNRSRLMILPEGVTKATGLREALAALRRSAHNTVGIGDAANDHSLLEYCEVGLAVAWGSLRLKAVADALIDGSGPGAVAGRLRWLAAQDRLSPDLTARRRLLLGHDLNGGRVMFPVLGRNLLIAGGAGSGKSWVAGLLAEELILQRYCVCIVDPEGDYRALESLPGVILLGGDIRPPRPGDILDALRHPDVSVIVELAAVPHAEKIGYIRGLLPALADIRRRTGLPHRLVLDEAHYFLDHPDVDVAFDLELAPYVLLTYRASLLRPEVLATIETIVFTRESAAEIRAMRQGFSPQLDTASWPALLGNLALGDAAVVSREGSGWGPITQVRLAPRITPHVRHRTKYFDVAAAESQPFIFTDEEGREISQANSLRTFADALASLSAPSVDGHVRRRDFSRWAAEVFRDDALTSSIEAVEAQYRPGQVGATAKQIVRAIHARYGERCVADP